MIALTLILMIFALLIFGFISLYNTLIQLKHDVDKSWANMDVLLKQRHDELPKLVETCRQFMIHEKDVLERVVQARSAIFSAREAGNMVQLGQAESALRAGLGQLFAVVENYPQLASNEQFQHLQRRITTLEETIADRREFYNETVNIFNVRIEQLPDLFVARLLGLRRRELLRFKPQELSDVDMHSLFAAQPKTTEATKRQATGYTNRRQS